MIFLACFGCVGPWPASSYPALVPGGNEAETYLPAQTHHGGAWFLTYHVYTHTHGVQSGVVHTGLLVAPFPVWPAPVQPQV